MTFIFNLIKLLVFVNAIHFFVKNAVVSKQIHQFIKKIYFRIILRRKYYTQKTKPLKPFEIDIQSLSYVSSIVFWNLISLTIFFAWPLHWGRVITIGVFSFAMYLLAIIEFTEHERLKVYYATTQDEVQKKDYEIRNINLAQAVVNLEKEVKRLRKTNSNVRQSKKNIGSYHIGGL